MPERLPRLHRVLRSIRAFFKPPRQLRFTREGKWFVGMVLIIGVAAINTGINLLYLILAMMLSLIITSGLLSEMSLRHVRLSLSWPSSAFAGEEFSVQVTLINGKHHLPSFSLYVSPVHASGPGWQLRGSYVIKLPPGERWAVWCRGRAERRGLHRFQGFRLTTRFPFDLFEKSVTIPSAGSIVIYPRLGRVQWGALSLERADPRLPNQTQIPLPGGEEEFHSLREYRLGDNPKWIHWRSSARQERLMVKEFEKSSSKRVALLLDTLIPPGLGEAERERLELAIRFVASLAQGLVREGYQLFFGAYAPELQRLLLERGGRELHGLYRVLALLDPSPERGLEELWREVSPLIPPGSSVLLVSLEGMPAFPWIAQGNGLQWVDVGHPDFASLFSEG
ncbi:MAG: DUF58 domain-containing protein [Candidatus Tectomicrobia bacterium]|uniref:DUF58 domain-containing protein n=1 Tax=Tectimicrobiota bacterium TaxID=2528274 RepID=A0A932CP20_UNCTE|nr:DUF58 domain-containing protein [Candidatus Tectomicrobia bacterium]